MSEGKFLNVKFSPSKNDAVVFNPYQYGVVECDKNSWDIIFGVDKADLILLTERTFVKIINFDDRSHIGERDFDLLKFDIIRGEPSYSLCFFVKENDTYVFVYDNSDKDIISAAKLEGIKKDISGFGITLRNGRHGISSPKKFLADTDEISRIADLIDKYILEGYPE